MELTSTAHDWKRHFAHLGVNLMPVKGAPGNWQVSAIAYRHPPLVLSLTTPFGQFVVNEATLQAACGLMSLFGRREGDGPRRTGVPFAAVCGAVAAGQGIMAALIAQARGSLDVSQVSVNAGAATLFAQSHHVELTALGPVLSTLGAGKPPPFLTADGHRVEVETFRAERWAAFWKRLGVDGHDAMVSWRSHEARQWTACFRVPESLHRAAYLPLKDILQAAHGEDVCVSSVSSPIGDGLIEPWLLSPSPWTGPPPTEDLDEGALPPRWLPLAGMQVVEATHYLQGSYAGRVLACLGAQVWRVEPPDGDPARGVEPVRAGCSVSFRSLHRGKEALCVDLRSPRGRRRVHEVVAKASVFLTNWSPGKLGPAHLDYTTLRRINPSLVYAHATGSPPDDERWPHTASDWSIQSATGMGYAVRCDDEPPAVSQMTMLDPLGGLLCAEGILTGLMQRQHTGFGCYVESSLRHAAHVLMTFTRPAMGPTFHPLPTKSGYLAVDDTRMLRRRLGLGPDATRKDFARALRPADSHDWEDELRRDGLAATRVRTMDDIIENPLDPAWLRYDNGIHVAPPWRIS
ncbi:CoA transferase [Streptomyces sp. NPDC090022]|uniref:CoA transferase n=1 Tax=Streptomyces sp. NPDC090022 TaxID=3365920 RepID=UPI0037FA018C